MFTSIFKNLSKRGRQIVIIAAIVLSSCYAFWLGQRAESDESISWDERFKIVTIVSSTDGVNQEAYIYETKAADPKPLIVSLHTWSGDYTQADPLAKLAADLDWNYIHPNFRGPNWTQDACLSDKVISDIDDAIEFVTSKSKVDEKDIFVVGASGGGYAALGSYLKTQKKVNTFISWVPISDLASWYKQSVIKKQNYADNILKCTTKDGSINEEAMRTRSPLFWPANNKRAARLEIYSGLNDGYDGSVPINHSILFFNKMVRARGHAKQEITDKEAVQLLSREVVLTENKMGPRSIYFSKEVSDVSLTIFDGGHEILEQFTIERIKALLR